MATSTSIFPSANDPRFFDHVLVNTINFIILAPGSSSSPCNPACPVQYTQHTHTQTYQLLSPSGGLSACIAGCDLSSSSCSQARAHGHSSSLFSRTKPTHLPLVCPASDTLHPARAVREYTPRCLDGALQTPLRWETRGTQSELAGSLTKRLSCSLPPRLCFFCCTLKL